MMVRSINYILKQIERKADTIGYDIDANADYCLVCQIITDFEYDGTIPTMEQRQFCADTLKALCAVVGLNYGCLLTEAMSQKCHV